MQISPCLALQNHLVFEGVLLYGEGEQLLYQVGLDLGQQGRGGQPYSPLKHFCHGYKQCEST